MSEFSQALDGVVDEVERIGVAETKGAVKGVMRELKARTPKETNFAAASLRAFVGEIAPGFPQGRTGEKVSLPDTDSMVDTVFQGFELGMDPGITALAGYYNILAGGRRPDKNGRMIGSEQAKDPFIEPAIKAGLRVANGGAA